MGGQEVVSVHGDEDGGVGILGGDEADGAIADSEVVGEVDLFERGIFADKFDGEGAGFSLTRDLRGGIAGEPAVVVASDALQYVDAWFRREESFVAPALGEGAREAGVVRMGDEPPARFCF